MRVPKVVVPYTNLHPTTKQVLETYKGLEIEFVKLEHEHSYGRLLKRLWDEQETVVVIEHDIVPWPGAIEELYHCAGQWCSCSYLYGGGYGLYHGLGCTKLSSQLMRSLPGLWDENTEWSQLDRKLLFAAREIRQEPHPHRPPVIHLNTKQTAVPHDN